MRNVSETHEVCNRWLKVGGKTCLSQLEPCDSEGGGEKTHIQKLLFLL